MEVILRGEVERRLKEMTPVLAQNLSEHGFDFHPLLSSSLSEAGVQRAHRALGLIRFLSTDAATCPELSRTSQPGTDTFSLASEASLLTQVGVTCVTCMCPRGGCGAE